MDRRKGWTAMRVLFVAGALCYSVLLGHAMTNVTADTSGDGCGGGADANQLQGTFLSNDICRVDPMVPNVVGQLQADAQRAITNATLAFAISTANSETVPAGWVISQAPLGGGSALSGSTVALVISVGPVAGGGSLSPWLAQDVGAVGVAGSTTGNATSFSMSGSGSDIWNTADAFQFVYQPLVGDGQIIARLASLQNTDAWAKAGVMIRDGLTPDARYAALVVTPGNGLAFQRRLVTGGPSIYTPGTDAAPTWVKLVRAGTTLTASHSADGVSWTPVGSDTLALSTTVYIGLAVTSHNNGVAAAAAFDNVGTAGSAPAPNAPPTVSVTSPSPVGPFTAPATITLEATAADTDGAITRVDYFISTSPTPIGSSTSGPTYTAMWSGVAAGTFSVTARATDNGGATTTSDPVIVNVAPPFSTVPGPWAAQDIGAVGVAGTTTGNGTSFSVSGSGTDIWDTADAFQFVYQPLVGDGQIVARVVTEQNTDPWAKAGVMIREDLTPGSRNAALVVSPANGLAFQRRLVTGAASTYTPGTGAAPTWVKLVRSGSTLSAYGSTDGVSWAPVGSDTFALSTTVYIGLAVTSHSNGVAAAATFDTVTVP